MSFTILYLRAISRDEYNIESRRLAAYFKSHPKIIRSAIDETFPRDNFGRWIDQTFLKVDNWELLHW